MRFWLKNVAIALDQFANAALLHGFADETLSSRCHRLRLAGKPFMANAIDAILFFDKDHCKEAYESERLGRQLPPELRPRV